jgi:alkylhydroperoxidase family enzyme
MRRYKNNSGRVTPVAEPLDPDVQAAIDAVMRGRQPLVLFTTLARDPRLFGKFFAGGLLDRGHLGLREREIVIDRVTARCGAEYEWGVHVGAFAAKARLDEDQIRSLTSGRADDGRWDDDERVLIEMCDALHVSCTVDDDLWEALRRRHSEEAIMELLMLAGFYRTVSYLVNALRLPLEPQAARFADVS